MSGQMKLDAAELGRRLAPWSGNAKDQADWQRWLKAKQRSWHDFRTLVAGNARPAIKLRAQTAMLVWDPTLDPFKGRGATEFAGSSLFGSQVDRDKIDVASAAVTVLFCLQALDLGAKPDQGGTRHAYNGMVPGLLAVCGDESVCEQLFERFHVRDDGPPHGNMDEASGYNPYQLVFYVEGLSDTWKRRIDERMRAAVMAELEGRAEPRAEHEAADGWYADTTFRELLGEPRRSPELFEAQIGFLASLPTWSENVLDHVRMYARGTYARLQGRRGIGSACHRLIRRAVIEGIGDDAFRLNSLVNLTAARAWLEEYASDQPLVDCLRQAIAVSAPRIEEEARVEADAKAQLDEVAAALL